jgi:hypothetical protein
MSAGLAASVAAFVFMNRTGEFEARLASFFLEEAPRIRAHYGAALPKVVEFDDGIIGFSLDGTTMSATLAVDPETARAKAVLRLFHLANERGFDHMATFVYADSDLASLVTRSDGAAEWARRRALGEDLTGFEFSFDYVSPSREFAIVRMTARAQAL